MIIEALLNIVFSIVNTLINILPVFDISALGGFSAIIGSLMACSAFMPLGALQIALSIWMGVQALKLASSILNWCLRKILLG